MTVDEYKYNVAIKGTKNGICHDEIIAFDMELDDAVILVRAYFDTYYAEPEMSLSIERVQREE